MVTYVCPFCEMRLDDRFDYRDYLRGFTIRGSRTPPKCKIGKANFWGIDKQALELTQAISQGFDPAVKSKYIETIRRSRQPPEPTVKLLPHTEIDALSEEQRSDYGKLVTDEDSGEWRSATHAEMRKKWCYILVDKLRELGLLEGPRDGEKEAHDTIQEDEHLNDSREEKESGDEEPAPKKLRRTYD